MLPNVTHWSAQKASEFFRGLERSLVDLQLEAFTVIGVVVLMLQLIACARVRQPDGGEDSDKSWRDGIAVSIGARRLQLVRLVNQSLNGCHPSPVATSSASCAEGQRCTST
jgi:hypothetical protein